MQAISPLVWYGGKARLSRQLVELIPRHRVYVEPFAGSAAMLYRKDPAPREILNDIHPELMNFWRIMQNNPKGLQAICRGDYTLEWFLYCRDNYRTIKASSLQRARMFLTVARQSYRGYGHFRVWDQRKAIR